MQILPNAIVRVRRRRWRVTEVRAFDACELVTLRGVTPGDAGIERRVLSPFDRLEPAEPCGRPKHVSRARWRRACRVLLAGDTPPGALRSAAASRIDLWPYQLEPALAIVRGLGCRLLLADEVGLGKTIQAGLIASELRARGAVDRILVLTPAGIRDQWRGELADRFGLTASIVDARTIREAAATLPFDVNPWATFDLAIASLDYVKRPEVLPAVAARPWDLVIVDEAHGAASDSERHAAAHALAAEASYVLLLTATPHSGDARAYASLCRLGEVDDEPPLVFRRTRRDAGLAHERRVRTLSVGPTADERRMHARLRAYAAAVRAERSDAALALSVLDKRALSSARALADSVDRRLAALDADANARTVDEQLALPLDFGGEETPDDEPPRWPEELRLVDRARDRRLLQAVAAAAHVAAKAESKIGALVRCLRRTNERALVFTEYRDTLRHVAAAVAAAVDRRVLILHGGMTRDERGRALRSFAREPRAVLVATDAAGEGLNLHGCCRLVVNLELPWNPMRLEQRIGRVDRLGQRRVVHALHLVARDTGEAALLARLEARVAEARSAIGAPDPLGGTGGDDAATPRVGENLEAAGREERRRALCARLLLGGMGDGARADEPRPLVAAASTGARRQLLGRRLEIWRADAEDGCGRIAESHIVALAVARDVESVDGAVAAGLAEWRAAVERNTASFVGARVRRETAVASSRGTVDRYQPGLFDRRHAREHDAAVAAVRAWREHVSRRLDAGRLSAALSFPPPRLRLLIEP